MAAAKEEFLVKFKYWLVVGGIITRSACGITISFKVWGLLKPRDFEASFWPLLIAKIPALTFSAIKAEVYILDGYQHDGTIILKQMQTLRCLYLQKTWKSYRTTEKILKDSPP